MASLNKIFNISKWEPESLSPNNNGSDSSSAVDGVNAMSLSLAIEADSATTTAVLYNIDHSIREFDISNATIEWGGDNSLILHAKATAFYVNESTIQEKTTTIKGDKSKK